MTKADPKDIRRALGDVDFPASKEALVEHAERSGADEESLRALRALPLGDYRNPEEVLRSVPLPPDRSASEARNDSA